MNGIAVGEQTFRATERQIDYREAAPVEAKGKARPVSVWEAIEARSRAAVDRVQGAALVGRERELDALEDALARVLDERSCQLVTLVGVPGIGKSRLVLALYEAVERHPGLIAWRQGRCLPYGDGVTFWALGEMVKAQVGILDGDKAADAERKLATAVSDPWVASQLRPLVGLAGAGPSGGDRRGEAFAAWRRFFEGLAEERPLVLVLEDLHWADDNLLDFVDYLVEWASGVPLLVVCTARPELLSRRPGWGGGKPNALTISLAALSDGDTRRLLAALLGSVLPAETQVELLARAGGNPLYAEELARMLCDRGAIGELPETLQGLIAARLDLLDQEHTSLGQDAAVIGKRFWLGALASVSGGAAGELEGGLHVLERREFVRRERSSTVAEDTEYAFRHLLVRDVAYGQLPRAERAERHRRTAEWIRSIGRPEGHAEMLAHHYVEALELSEAAGVDAAALAEPARRALRDAGDRAFGLNAWTAAARFYSRALELSRTDGPERPELLFGLGRALLEAGDAKAEEALERAAHELVASGCPERAAEARACLSELWWDRGKRDRAFEQLDRARELLDAEESEARARVLARLGRQQLLAGEYQAALDAGGAAFAIADRLGLDELRAHVLNTVGMARTNLGDAGGIADVEKSAEIALEIGSPLAASSYNNLGEIFLCAGDVRRDQEVREESLRLAERFGDARKTRFVRGVLIGHAYFRGRWQEALQAADAFIAECEAGAPHYLEGAVRALRAIVRLARGEADAASADALRGEQQAREAKDLQLLLGVLAARLRLELELGRVEHAAAVAAELLAGPPNVAWLSPGVELAWAAERLEIADPVRAWIDGIAFASTWSDAALLLPDGELGRAADLFAKIGSLPDEARARLRAGDPENVAKALAFYRAVGAARYVREAEPLLAASA